VKAKLNLSFFLKIESLQLRYYLPLGLINYKLKLVHKIDINLNY